MHASIVDHYRHARPIFNCTQFAAWGVARRLMTFGWHNLRYGFAPIIITGVSLEPSTPDYDPPDESDFFDLKMFEEGGFLHEEPMNHYIMMTVPGRKGIVSINAGYLMHHFVISEKLGYSEIARIIKHYKSKSDKPSVNLENVGEQGSANDSNTSGNDNQST